MRFMQLHIENCDLSTHFCLDSEMNSFSIPGDTNTKNK